LEQTTMEIIAFGSKDVDNILQRDPTRIEFLTFGAVLLDRMGKIVKYNSAEGVIVGRSAADVIGRNFFNDVAPCAKGKKFHGEFLKFSQTGNVNTMLDYEFDYKMKPIKVRIHLKSTPDNQQCWIFVKRV
jgi:photoactive yellow protein